MLAGLYDITNLSSAGILVIKLCSGNINVVEMSHLQKIKSYHRLYEGKKPEIACYRSIKEFRFILKQHIISYYMHLKFPNGAK